MKKIDKNTERRESGKLSVIEDVRENEDFGTLATMIFGELRASLEAMVRAVPSEIRRAVDLQAALAVDAPLAWRVFRIAGCEDPLEAAPLVPTRGQLARLVTAAKKKALASEVIERVLAAVAAYERFKNEHAEDRAGLDAMVAALRPTGEGLIDETTRRTAFRTMSLIWGLQSEVEVHTMIMHAGHEPGRYVVASLHGQVGLHTVRPGVPLATRMVSLVRVGNTEHGVFEQPAPAVQSRVFDEFISPGVEMRYETGEDGQTVERVWGTGIGRRTAVTWYNLLTREFVTDPKNHIDAVGKKRITTPIRAVHMDLIVPRGWTDPLTARMAVFGNRTEPQQGIEDRPIDLLPIQAPIARVENVTDAPPAAGVPRYPEIIRRTLEHLGWYGTMFDIYRCQMTYPVMHTVVQVRADAPRR